MPASRLPALSLQSFLRRSKWATGKFRQAAELAEIKSPTETTVAAPTPEERRIASEKKRAVLAEKQKAAWEARIKSPTYKDVDGNVIYNKAEQDPTFNGGERAMNTYFRDNVKFPEDAAKEGLDGTVYVEFVIAANGRVGEVTAARIPGEEVDQRFVDEALRVVRAIYEQRGPRRNAVRFTAEENQNAAR